MNSLESLVLDLSNNQIGKSGMNALYEDLFKINKVKIKSLRMDITDNHLGKESFKVIFPIGCLRLLTYLHLDLSKYNIGNKGINVFTCELVRLTNLKNLILYLCENNIENEGIFSLSSAMIQLTNLRSLTIDVSKNKIDSDGLNSIFCSLKNLEYLNVLNLFIGENKINDTGLSDLVEFVREKKPLLSELNIDFSKNNIQDVGVFYFAELFIKMKFFISFSADFKKNLISRDMKKLLIKNFSNKVSI